MPPAHYRLCTLGSLTLPGLAPTPDRISDFRSVRAKRARGGDPPAGGPGSREFKFVVFPGGGSREGGRA
eukprot:4214423-Pyramimonas_sp.AAC.1